MVSTADLPTDEDSLCGENQDMGQSYTAEQSLDKGGKEGPTTRICEYCEVKLDNP